MALDNGRRSKYGQIYGKISTAPGGRLTLLGIITMPVHRLQSEDAYMVWPDDAFTGEWIVEWPNGRVKFRSLYLKGREEGDYLCYWPNGKLAQKGYSQDRRVRPGFGQIIWRTGRSLRRQRICLRGNYDVRWLTVDGQVREIEIVRVGQERRTEILIPDT